MKELDKVKYVPPTMEVNPVELEANIALQSPIQRIDAEEWAPEQDFTPDTGDIFLSI